MDDSKRYYWLKLPDDWYEDDTIAFLEDNGIEYSYFYLKLCSLSVKYNGNVVRIVGSTAMPYTVEMLAKKTRTNIDTVRVCLELFEQLGLIERYDDGNIFISQIEEMIGKETEGARRKRIQRAKSTLLLPDGGTMSHECPKDVPQSKKEEVESETENIDIDRDNITPAKAVATRESIPKEEVDEIIRLWNEIPEVNNVISISKTSQRYKSLSARIKEFSYDTVIEAIRLVSTSDFLRGKINSFKITFDWFVKPNNFVKIIEGNYNPKDADKKNDETREDTDAYQG